MPLPRNDYLPQLAIVGNARLRGRDLRAQVIDDPGGAALVRGPDDFGGFALPDGGFEPSFYVWLDAMKARGLVALRVLTDSDPADWILQAPPPSLPRLPDFVLVFGDREAGYGFRFEHGPTTPKEVFVPVEVPRRVAIPPVDAAERELLEATRGYVRFLEGKVRRDDRTAVFYEAMGREALEQLTATEARFQELLAARRKAQLHQLRKDYKPQPGYTKELRPGVLEQADRVQRMTDFARVMEEAGLSWRTQRLALVASGLSPLNMRHERTSEDTLPDYVRHPGYIAVGSRLAKAACDGRNAALNASA
ncbi:hypothetical protein [Corallococcus aberystwythensis]|uniref:Uncharacterized protein n=1 Tax=Corallococcus aberystwythensis TaxID=2316722 RepID=A0A3A8QI13_9BACT|nr:hypothetical protein [Corallococcus aberystwythensis]RKH67351.1 hypothetical protein D7W81_14025 [Corallococcus aberystwythensis]